MWVAGVSHRIWVFRESLGSVFMSRQVSALWQMGEKMSGRHLSTSPKQPLYVSHTKRHSVSLLWERATSVSPLCTHIVFMAAFCETWWCPSVLSLDSCLPLDDCLKQPPPSFLLAFHRGSWVWLWRGVLVPSARSAGPQDPSTSPACRVPGGAHKGSTLSTSHPRMSLSLTGRLEVIEMTRWQGFAHVDSCKLHNMECDMNKDYKVI